VNVAAEAAIWHRVGAALKGERLLSHNVIVAAGTMTAGALGVAFQALVSHRLSPPDFGGVFAVVTLITFVGLPSTAFTLLMARATSRDRASGQDAPSSALLRKGSRALMLSGLGLAVATSLMAAPLGRYLDLSPVLLVAGAVGFPFGLALPLLLGEFQGEQRFFAFSMLAVGQAGLKLIGAIGLGALFGSVGVIAGISLASAAIYGIAYWSLRRKLKVEARLMWWRPAASYLAVVLPSTLALGALLSVDVLFVKHFFPTRAAGEYAAVAALGRAIFWGASGVAAVLFPKVVISTTQGRSGSQLISASLVLVTIGGLAGLAVLSMGSRWLMTAFAGGVYADSAGYVPWYALGMTMLGGVAVLVATLQSQGRPGFLAVLLPLTIMEPALLMTMHESLLQVVQAVDVSMAVVLLGLGAFYVIQERVRRSAAGAANNTTADQRVADLVLSQ
jgi:O-antigen/teichoic acid export membrane protein